MKIICDCLKKNPGAVIGLLAWIYTVGIAGLSLNFTRELFQFSTPITLLLSLFLLIAFHEPYSLKFVLVAVAIYIAGVAVEIAGVATGLVFGAYSYGPTLGVKIWGTPLMIGVNWLYLVYSVWIILQRLRWPKVFKYLLGAAMLVVYDIFMEPVAIWTDMWHWDDIQVPLQNYIAWFVISFVFLGFLGSFTENLKNKIAPALFIIQLLFFVILNAIIHYFF